MHRNLLLLAVLFTSYALPAFSQSVNYPAPAQQPTRPMFNVAFGVTSPLGRSGLREFWLGGPNATAKFHVQINPFVFLGVGADLSLQYFDLAAFQRRWPGVNLAEKQNLFLGNVFVDATYAFLPHRQTRPFFSLQLGAEFISEALYREIKSGVRYTYFNVGGKPRLTVAAATGATIYLSYNFGIVAELKGTLVHNDPNVSLLAHLRAGIQYKL